MKIDELNYLTLLWIEQLAGAKLDKSDTHMRHALRDFIYATEVLRGMIRLQMDESNQPIQNPQVPDTNEKAD